MPNPKTSATEAMPATQVKDCPFCGGKGTLISRYFTEVTTYSVECVDCTGMVEGFLSDTGVVGFVYEDEAIAAWNRRVR